MSFSFLGIMGSASASGTVSSIDVPITVPFPDMTALESVSAIVFVMTAPGLSAYPVVTDDAVAADSAVFGTRWSPYAEGAPVGSTDPPAFGPVNPWTLALEQLLTLSTTEWRAMHGLIFVPPDTISLAFAEAQTDVYVVVYGVQGLKVAPVSTTNPALQAVIGGGWSVGGGSYPYTVSDTVDPGFLYQLCYHTPISATVLNMVTDASSTTEATLEAFDSSGEAALTWRPVASPVSTIDVEWDGDGGTANAEDIAIADNTIAVPDALTLTITATPTDMGAFNRYVVTLVDSAGIASNTTNHHVTPYWRILEAPGGGPGLDGTWDLTADDVTSTGNYVVRNPIDSGLYVDVPSGATYTLRGFLYDGFLSAEVDVTLVGPVGTAPFFHHHYAGS